jgi:hypothetical protein
MKKAIFFFLFISAFSALRAQCPAGFGQLGVQIIPDEWPYETTWNITNPETNSLLAQGTETGDTICVPLNSCVLFQIFDSYGDGIYAPGGYWLSWNGTVVAQGNSFGSGTSHSIACQPGTSCTSALTISEGTHTAAFDNSWFEFTPTITGMYVASTCSLATCDTRVYIYSSCPQGAGITDGPEGTEAYNDNICGNQSSVNVMMLAGQNYFIRIGDSNNDCSGPVDFSLAYNGPVTGCMDPQSCNFNPLATADDGTCIYFPDPLCSGPDLAFDSVSFVSSLNMVTHNAQGCDITEGCVTGYGLRQVIQFTSKIDNIGPQDYYIGNPSTQPGMFNLVNCHGHTHYEGYGDYRLYDTQGNIIPAGHKNGFCVMDLCGFGQYGCSDMGISAGCYDVYGAGTQCQWIDVTDVPDGDYRLAVIVNAQHLPDALGRQEINYINNALQVCLTLTTVNGVRNFQVQSGCEPFVDCAGIPGGASVPDCNGDCGGTAQFGNVLTDNEVNHDDVEAYMDLFMQDEVPFAPCYDLNGNSSLSVFDAALQNWCIWSNVGNSFQNCLWPRNIDNPSDTTSLSIANVNFGAGYVDIELRSKNADVMAYQFTMSGIEISDVVSLTTPADQPKIVGFNAARSEVFGIYHGDSLIERQNGGIDLVRIYYSSITGSEICIASITDLINEGAEQTFHSVGGTCVEVLPTSIGQKIDRTHLTVVPNPAQDFIRVQVPDGFGKQSVWELISVNGASTQVISPNAGIAADVLQFSLRNLSQGIYLLRGINAEGKSVQGRIVKL